MKRPSKKMLGNGAVPNIINGRTSVNKKKRPAIKLPFVGAVLLTMYAIFVYFVSITFGSGSNDRDDPTSSSLSRLRPNKEVESQQKQQQQQQQLVPAAGAEEVKEPTVDEFCGLCQWKGQGFNCNERVEWVMKQKELKQEEAKQSELRYCINANKCNDKLNDHGFMECEELGHSMKPPASYTVGTSEHVQKEPALEAILSGALLETALSHELTISRPEIGTKKTQDEVGLRDRRTGEDIVVSVLTAAKYGDRRYDTQEEEDAFIARLEKEEEEEGGGEGGGRKSGMPVLTAYCEAVNQTTWETRPLPRRDGLTTPRRSPYAVPYPHVRSCRALHSQWPIDTPPVDLDPFLPWIHDVFPSHDGKNVVFVAQNRRRCYNGQRSMRVGERAPKGVTPHKNFIHIDYAKNYFMRPQSALFQHVPVKRMPPENPGGDDDDAEPRYRLASHEEADEDGMETRFICRFKRYDPDATPNVSIVGYSLSKHVVDYDYHTYRKGYLKSATAEGFDNHMIWQSQLLFNCPVPPTFHERVRNGDTVVDDYATLYVDVVPIRTAPRYTPPREFLQPKYGLKVQLDNTFIPDIEWGKDHVLPKIDESGRWENIPVCMPSLMAHGIVPKGVDVTTRTIPENESDKKYAAFTPELPPKVHKVIACTWASASFRTRGNRAHVDDGKRRLQEWLEFNLLSGFDHIYIYDNSGAFTNQDSLADIIDIFPRDMVTRVDWPCKICSNRDGNEGERSSQYAAESSCRLRFGTHARWLGSFDTDEYLVPMGGYDSMGEVADELDQKGVKVAAFKSSPAKPRFDLLENYKETIQSDGSFTPTVTENETFLHTYNCNWEQFPRQNDFSHRRKQMYRADYVQLHYVHYSTITVVSQMSEKETIAAKESWMHRYKEGHMHEFDEDTEATMLHTKTKLARNMNYWTHKCREYVFSESHCNVGFPFPKGVNKVKAGAKRDDGWAYNCFLNDKIEEFWWPKLADAVKSRKEIANAQ
mmetsp:Transcript_26722/g.64111  ORF Transcript_26722/g.64111 Transcript_26722/m.64111 type:complete len:986 (+) Transcript_26722:105-3062(+)